MDREGRFDGWYLYLGDLDIAPSRAGYCERPFGKFNESDWETTTNIVAIWDRFVFDFSGGPSDEVLVMLRIYYSL